MSSRAVAFVGALVFLIYTQNCKPGLMIGWVAKYLTGMDPESKNKEQWADFVILMVVLLVFFQHDFSMVLDYWTGLFRVLVSKCL